MIPGESRSRTAKIRIDIGRAGIPGRAHLAIADCSESSLPAEGALAAPVRGLGGANFSRLTAFHDSGVTLAVDETLPNPPPISDTCRTAPESPPYFTAPHYI